MSRPRSSPLFQLAELGPLFAAAYCSERVQHLRARSGPVGDSTSYYPGLRSDYRLPRVDPCQDQFSPQPPVPYRHVNMQDRFIGCHLRGRGVAIYPYTLIKHAHACEHCAKRPNTRQRHAPFQEGLTLRGVWAPLF